MDLKNKVAIITGGSRGIGFSIVKRLLNEGIKFIALFEIDNPESRKIINELQKEYNDRVGYYPTDVTNTTQLRENMEKFLKTHTSIDILINNAGIITENVPERMIDINYKSLVLGSLMMIELVGKHKGGKGGTIVNIGSIFGLINTGLPIYCSTKHAVVSFTRNMKDQFNKSGVRVVAVCPGVTDTPMVPDISKGLEIINTDEAMNKLENCNINMRQSPENVATAVIQILENGKSGDVWVSDNNMPPYPVKDVDDYSALRIE